MSALRNKNNPKSANLSSMVKNIVSDLEDHFDTYEKDKRGGRCLNLHQARSDAFNSTCGELPKIKKTTQVSDTNNNILLSLHLSPRKLTPLLCSALL